MQSTERMKLSPEAKDPSQAVLELSVNNHPGVMSHVCSLFSRRAYNMDGIACMPFGNGEESRIWIRVNNNRQLEQIVKQLQKLEDVHTVRNHAGEHEVFAGLEKLFQVK